VKMDTALGSCNRDCQEELNSISNSSRSQLGPSETGYLIPLKTTLETRKREVIVDVWVTVIGVKQASLGLGLIRNVLPDDGGVELGHLRRFAKLEDVPQHVRDIVASRNESQQDTGGAAVDDIDSLVKEVLRGVSEATADLVNSSEKELSTDEGDAVVDAQKESSTKRANIAIDLDKGPATERLLVVGATSVISRAEIIEVLSAVLSNPIIFSIPAPLLAPTSQEHATLWSSRYWPTVYKKTNPFGPHPSIASRAELEIRDEVKKWMGLATEVARQAGTTGSGEAVGVVIVERRNGVARPVAVAGDARWLGWPCNKRGNVTAHAALRAIAMVSEGLRLKDETKKAPAASSEGTSIDAEGSGEEQNAQKSLEYSPSGSPIREDYVTNKDARSIFRDRPLLEVEKGHYDTSGNENGYLCHDLELYCTHEPCVMCSMAIVHSRFGRVIFEQRMPDTGGLCADGKLGHGLFWRKELNWTLLAWQWAESSVVGKIGPPGLNA
jgi:tRNA-specific adenosine deaminase 3